jgi:uncharacterized membrane protein YdfJ with MMPL/SSD domain
MQINNLKKKIITISFITLFLIIILLFILYNNGILEYLDIETVILLLKNKINIFKIIINNNQPCGNPNSMSSGDLALLIEELRNKN